METASKINEILKAIQEREHFTDQQLAEYAGVSRWTLRRIRNGAIGETISTSLVGAVLQEQARHPTNQAA